MNSCVRLHFLPVSHQKEESETNSNVSIAKLAGKHGSKTLQRSPTLQSQHNLPPIDSANQETRKLLQVNPNPVNIRNMKVPVNNSCQSKSINNSLRLVKLSEVFYIFSTLSNIRDKTRTC